MQQIQHHTPFQRFALLLLVVVLIASGAFLILSLMSNMPTSAVQAAAPAAEPNLTLCGYMAGAACYHFFTETDDNGYMITDERDKRFLCTQQPTNLADMEYCSYYTGE